MINYALGATLVSGLVVSGVAYSMAGAKVNKCKNSAAIHSQQGLLVLGAVLSTMAIVQFMNGPALLEKANAHELRMMFGGVCAVVSVVVIALGALIYDKCKPTGDKTKDPNMLDSKHKNEAIALIVLGVLSLGASGYMLTRK